MDADWIKSPSGRRVLVHWADPRPAWLWSGDGTHLLWRNPAARFFAARLKKSGLKLAPETVPIKGQVPRILRLGSPGRSSLSRIQFLAGDKPVSTTCTCTPLDLPGDRQAVLIVGVDPINPELLATAPGPDRSLPTLLPPGLGYLVFSDDGRIIGGSGTALDLAAPLHDAGELPTPDIGESGTIEVDGRTATVTRFRASQGNASVLLIEGIEPIAAAEARAQPFAATEPLLPFGLPPLPAGPEPEADGHAESDHWVPPSDLPQPASPSLVSLFDRLANDAELYAGLEPAVELPPEPIDAIGAIIDFDEPEDAPPSDAIAPEPTAIADAPAPDSPAVEAAPVPEPKLDPAAAPVLYRVTARMFEPLQSVAEEPAAPEAETAAPPPHPDPETVERVSRYNFDELSRILTDRVGTEPPVPTVAAPPRPPAPAQPEGQLVSLAGETFILNRLPLGILVFRDQQVLFANRSITEMTGHGSVEELRNAGLDAIFPAANGHEAGPVNHLVQRDGTLLPVTARLQQISWQGRPALMLSASATEVRTGHEAAVRAFAELMAEQRGEGFMELNRAGVVSMVSARAMEALSRKEPQVAGKPLSGVIDPGETRTLQEFLERPARFAEAARPALVLKGAEPNTEILLFAQGQAGVVTGYFGLVRRSDARTLPALTIGEIEPALLARLSRGVRRPLNTIIGFADLIRSATFGAIGNERYAEYARDIKTAGHEIAALVDELDDYARLRDGRFAPRPTEIDLKTLLESCVARVRTQAGAARVLVRSAISERLPHVRADRSSLGQAILNLLSSAIGQTPAGGTVILSAQLGEDDSIAVNVRDNGVAEPDPGERFVVFRDGQSRDGEALVPVRSSVGLALTRSLAAVNSCALSIDPAAGNGTLFSLTIPSEAVSRPKSVAAD